MNGLVYCVNRIAQGLKMIDLSQHVKVKEPTSLQSGPFIKYKLVRKLNWSNDKVP